MTPAQLRRRAAAEREKARKATALAELYEETARQLEAIGMPRLLQPASRQRKVFTEHMLNLSPEAKARKNLAISKKASKDPLAKACHAHGISVRALARTLNVSPGSLVAYRSTRAIPGALADAIEASVGFAATKANWPGGIDR